MRLIGLAVVLVITLSLVLGPLAAGVQAAKSSE